MLQNINNEYENVTNIHYPYEKNEKYIGVIFHPLLILSKHVATIIIKDNSIIALTLRCIYIDVDKDALCLHFKTLTLPPLEYANNAWSPALQQNKLRNCEINKL